MTILNVISSIYFIDFLENGRQKGHLRPQFHIFSS